MAELRPISGVDFYSLVVQTKMMMVEPLCFNLHIFLPSEYETMRCFAYRYGPRAAGFAIREDGELVNVFSLTHGRGDEIVQQAIREGAKRLDCYDGHLVRLYKRNGFVETGRVPWDWQYADPRWRKEWGEPDVVFMELKNHA